MTVIQNIKQYTLMAALASASLCNLSAASTWPSRLEQNISPCRSAYIEVDVPQFPDQTNARMHGVIVDQNSNSRYLIYEPLGKLREEAHANGKGSLLCAALGITLCTGPLFAKQLDAMLRITLLKKIVAGCWVQGLIYSFAAATIWGYKAIRHSELRNAQWNPEQHLLLYEHCAKTLKKSMQLPTNTSTEHLCFGKLGNREFPNVTTTRYHLPLFQAHGSLSPIFTACDQIAADLRSIKNKHDLDIWSQNTDKNPLLQLRQRFSQSIFSPLAGMRIGYNIAPWWFPKLLYCRSFVNTSTHGTVYIPPSVSDAFTEALKRGGTDIDSCLLSINKTGDLEQFNEWLRRAGYTQLSAESTNGQLKKAYHAASLKLHPDKLKLNHSLQERLRTEGITDMNEPSKSLNELYAKLCPVGQ